MNDIEGSAIVSRTTLETEYRRLRDVHRRLKVESEGYKLAALQEAHNAILADHAALLARARALIAEDDTDAAMALMAEAVGVLRAAYTVKDLLVAEAQA